MSHTVVFLVLLSIAYTHAEYQPPQGQQSRILRAKERTSDQTMTTFFLHTDQDKMIAILPKNNFCKFYGSKQLINAAIEEEVNKVVVSVDDGEFKNVINDCYIHIRQNPTLYFAYQNDIQLIFPGTKWCGDGDIADNYDDLGFFEETDKCCRDHDHCFDWIAAGETEHGLTNDSPFTRSHCDCDNQLKSCLSSAGEVAGDTIGLTYFSILGMKCFKEDYPIVSCNQYGGLFNLYCQDYELDEAQDKIWEYFDDSEYETVEANQNNKPEQSGISNDAAIGKDMNSLRKE